MASEVFKLKTLDIDYSIIRQSRVGFKNNPTSKLVFASPDTMGETIYSGETGIYTGERNVSSEYLVQGSVSGNNIRTEAVFTKKSKVVTLTNAVPGIKGGDLIRNDVDSTFYDIESVDGTIINLVSSYDSENFDTPTYTGPATLRKEIIGNAEFEYVKSITGQNKIYFNQDKSEWGVTGVEITGPIDTQEEIYKFPPDDYMTVQFQESTTDGAPVITAVKSERFTVVNDNKNEIADLGLNAVPYPHESLKVYWGPVATTPTLKEENKDYVVNYSQEPDYQYPFPPQDERQVAFLKFLEEINQVQATINNEFTGNVSVSKISSVSGADDLVTAITDIVPESEEVKVSSSVVNKDKDYIIDYEAGLITFVDHKNNESLIGSVNYPKSLLWDGVSVIRGVGKDQVRGGLTQSVNENLVIRPMSGLEGITGIVYYEDTDENNLTRDEDYLLEYDSGAIRINQTLDEDESVLVSYYVEGIEEENENLLNRSELRVKKFPLMAGSVVLTKVYTDETGTERSKVLEEGTDFEISVLTGIVTPLAEGLSGDNIRSLEISYVPMAQVHVILQPDNSGETSHRMTIIDDALEITSPFALKFKIRNPQISIPEENPFKGEDDLSRTSYDSSIIEGSIQNIRVISRSGFGFAGMTKEEIMDRGITGLAEDGISTRLGITDDMLYQIGVTGVLSLGAEGDLGFDMDGYVYNDEYKEISLDESKNAKRPDLNDVVAATYSFISDTLPYYPIEAIFPVISEGLNYFYIEGYDRTDVITSGMVLRIDNFDPEASYFFKLKSVIYSDDSTRVEVYGSFPTDIRNPSFYLFDSRIGFTNLPDNTTVVAGMVPGSVQVAFEGNLLQITNALRTGVLLQIDGQFIYQVQAINVQNNLAIVDVFPSIQTYCTSSVTVSTVSVLEEGVSEIIADLPVLTDPAQPAFTISYNPPTDPVALEGKGFITIDNEKIILQEVVSGILNPQPYFFYYKNYSDMYTMAKAIQATKSTFGDLSYNPFTISSGDTEYYYLGSGSWATDTTIPFEEGLELPLPHTVTITPDLYKWKLISAQKNLPSFRIEDIDKTSEFIDEYLIALGSKVTGETYYHIVNGSSLVDNVNDSEIKDTLIKLKDNIRINFIDPYLYRYTNPVWENLEKSFLIDTNTSSLVFNEDLSDTLRPSMFFKFDDKYLYKIESVEVDSGTTTVLLSPDIYKNEVIVIKEELYPGYLKVTDIPLYINETTHQPSVTFTYTAATAHTGYAEISIDDEKIEIYEYVDGSDNISKTNTFRYANFGDIYELGDSIAKTESKISGHYPYSTNVASYKGLYELGGFDRFRVVPTYGVNKTLPYTSLVAKVTFEIEYMAPSGYTSGYGYIKLLSDKMVLKERVTHPADGVSEKEYEIVYSSYTSIYKLFDAIDGTVSSISGEKPFLVDRFSGSFDPIDFFSRGVYSIPAFSQEGFEDLNYPVAATTSVDSWSLLGPMNIRRLVLDTDYAIEGGRIALTNSVKKRDRLIFNYMGLNDLSEFENEDVTVFCRFYSALPTGYRVNAYMDYLNVDQYYIQKITERKFLEIVTVPQVSSLIEDKGGGGGSGADAGGNDTFPNYQAGIANLYYLLRDEQIKKLIYLKVYKWYKQRLRYFASEAQLILGFKFGNSTHYYTDGTNYSLLDQYVDDQIDYTLTTQDIIDEVENGLSVFFPVGYKGVAPKYYDRFRLEYKDYKDVYCYNVQYIDDKNKKEGRVRSWKPYWAPKSEGLHSDLDYELAKNASSELVSGYSVPFYKSDGTEQPDFTGELIYDSESSNFEFLKRVKVGDSLKIDGRDNYYKIGSILNRVSTELLSETMVMEDGKSFSEKGIKTYLVSKYNDVFPDNDRWLYKFRFSAGYIATPNEREEFVNGLIEKFGYTDINGKQYAGTAATGGVLEIETETDIDIGGVASQVTSSTTTRSFYREVTKQVNKYFSKKYLEVFVDFDIMETTFPSTGHRIDIKRQSEESFPVYDDEGNFGRTLRYQKIRGHITGKNWIRKPLTPLEILQILFPLPFATFPEPHEYFNANMGTFNEQTGEFVLGSFNYATDVFDEEDDDAFKSIDLSLLNMIEERKVPDNMQALTYNLAETDDQYEDGLDKGDVLPSYLEKGLGKFFDIDFERKYINDEDTGYVESLTFKTKHRDIWFEFPNYESTDEVNDNYGVPTNEIIKGFYEPKNLYNALIHEKQAWLTEELIIQDVFDVQLKMARVFKNAEINAGASEVTEGEIAQSIDYSQFREFLISIGNIILARINAYISIVRFLIRNTPGDLGPVIGIIQENDASEAIIESYNKGLTALSTYSYFLSKTIDDANSFYKRMADNINNWTNAYIRWILSLREGTMFQEEARGKQISENRLVIGFDLIDAIRIEPASSTSTVNLSNPTARIEYDLQNSSLALILTMDYETSEVSKTETVSFLFSSYTTLSSLVNAVNTYDYSTKVRFFTAYMVFDSHPKGSYTTLRLSPFTQTNIEPSGLTLQVLNVDDHRNYDSRVLFLNKQIDNSLVLDNEPAINPWPTYVDYYNDPADPYHENTDNFNAKKKAISGLKVPGEWVSLPTDYYDVISFSAYEPDHKISYLITAVYDEDSLDDLQKEQSINLVLPNRSDVERMVSIVDKIDNTGITVNGVEYPKTITESDYAFIDSTDRSKRTNDIFIKYLTIKLSEFGEDKTIRFNTRRYRTINDLVAAMGGYFYKDLNGEWQPARSTDDVTQPQFVRLLEADLIGDPLDQGESSSFELEIPYVPLLRSFYVLSELDNDQVALVEKKNILMGWVPDKMDREPGQSVTLRLNDNLEYSPGNTYGFGALTGETARLRSLSINSDHPNKNILPFDLYTWDTNASYEVRNNWLFLMCDSSRTAIPLTGATGIATYSISENDFVFSKTDTVSYPYLEGETVGDLVERINTSAAAQYFYANLKFVREEDADGNIGYFEYGYLPDATAPVSQSTLETIYLADDDEVVKLSASRAEDVQYRLNKVTPETDPIQISSMDIKGAVRVFNMSLNNLAYQSLNNATYKIDQIGGTLDLSVGYTFDYNYEIEFNLSDYATMSSLSSAVDALEVPLLTGPTVKIFSSTADQLTADPTKLKDTIVAAIPITLKNTSDVDVLTIQLAGVADSRVSVLSGSTAQIRLDKLTLKATLRYTGTYTDSISLSQNISNISNAVAAEYPNGDDGTYFSPLFKSSMVSASYAGTSGTNLNPTPGIPPINLVGTVYSTINASQNISALSTISDFVDAINAVASITGVDASHAAPDVSGYKSLHARYLSPTGADDYDVYNSISASRLLGALFSEEPGMRLLFMEDGGSYRVTSEGISVTTPLGTKDLDQSTDKDLDGWIDSIKGDYTEGLRDIDVLPIAVPGVLYGALADVEETESDGNDPTHVHFGFLGDIRFYQISDFNLYNELSMIKQRLAKPWKKSDGTFEDDWYNDLNFYDNYYGNSAYSGVAPVNNSIGLSIDRFLGYLRNSRFGEIRNSIQSEQLINNKYLWLYLKFHREMGCDQKVRDYLKKIKEDEDDAERLPQDL